MFILKDETVQLNNLSPQLLFGLTTLATLYTQRAGVPAIVITSCNDGKHSRTSLHYTGNAADVRSQGVARKTIESIVTAASEQLGPDFDVLWENQGKPNEHLHVEYQPKRRG